MVYFPRPINTSAKEEEEKRRKRKARRERRRKKEKSVTGLGPDYIIPGPWPELTLLALWFRQEPPLYYCK